jgi:transcription initiation factor TFIIIB Brf1 subunit/transcription initiation factor TFIIB
MEPPSIEEFVFITDNTYQKDDILRMESQILNILEFDLTVVTSIDFLDRYLKAARASDVASDMAHFLSELTLQEYKMIGYLPSAIAASCVILARFYLNVGDVWTDSMKQLTGFNGPELIGCIDDILNLLKQLSTSSLTAVKEKYSSESKNRVSALPFRSDFESDLLSI